MSTPFGEKSATRVSGGAIILPPAGKHKALIMPSIMSKAINALWAGERGIAIKSASRRNVRAIDKGNCRRYINPMTPRGG
jgi:hypothetical protein